MASAAGGVVWLFVGGVTGLTDRRPQQVSYPARVGAVLIPDGMLNPNSYPRSDELDPTWGLPPDESEAVRCVTHVAEAMQLVVKIVDVNRSGGDAALVARFFSSDDILPMLVRPDGQRLSGTDVLDKRRVQRFLA